MASSLFKGKGRQPGFLVAFLLSFSLFGCAGVRYRYSLDDLSLPTGTVSLDGVYTDGLLSASVSEIENGNHSLVGFRLKVENHSGKTLSLRFDQAAFVDRQEHRGPVVRGPDAPSQLVRLSPGQVVDESFYPAANYVRRVEHGRFLGMEFKPLIEWWDEQWEFAKLGLDLPVLDGEEKKEYQFVIRVKRV